MAPRKRPRTADHDPPPPTRKSPRVRTSTRQATLPPPSQAKSSRVRTSTQQAALPPLSRAKSSGVRTSTRQAMSSRPTRSTSARGKSSIIPTPTETPTETRSITTSEHHGDGPQDASDAGNSHGSSNTLNGRELAREALKIVNNAESAELMILELMDKYSFSFTRLKELLRGKLSQSRLFYHTKSPLRFND
jgi:hypothetical protein